MDLLSLLNNPSASVNSTKTGSSSNSSGTSSQDFQSLLMNMLSSSSSQGLSNSSSSSDSSGLGSSMSSMMMPMMFTLLEQLIMKEMQLVQASTPTAAVNTTAANAAVADTAAVTSNSAAVAQPQITELKQPAVLLANQARAAAAASAAAAQSAAAPDAAPTLASAPAAVSPQTIPVSTGSSHAIPYGEPVQGPLTQSYHSGHIGLDIGVYTGTPVKSTMDGKVIYAGWNTIGYGNLVIVQNGEYQTYYAHLSKIPVSVGETVQAGGVIGYSGSTGNSTGPHLHYEIRKNNTAIDPTSSTLGKSI